MLVLKAHGAHVPEMRKLWPKMHESSRQYRLSRPACCSRPVSSCPVARFRERAPGMLEGVDGGCRNYALSCDAARSTS